MLTGEFSAISTEVAAQLPKLERPSYLIAGGALLVAGITVERIREHRNLVPQGTQLADTDEAKRSLTMRQRIKQLHGISYYAGLGLASFMLAQGAHPYSQTTEMHGSADIVLNVGYPADAPISNEAGASSRLIAGVEGSVQAAMDNDVPFTFIVEGSKATIANTAPAKGKNQNTIMSKISDAVSATLRNGASLDDGVNLAVPTDKANNVIILSSDMNATEQGGIESKVGDPTKQANSNVFAIVLGTGDAPYNVGTETINAPVNSRVFDETLGSNNVYTAHSSDEITKDIHKIIERKIVSHQRKSSDVFENIAIGFGVLGFFAASRQKLGGIFKPSKKEKK